MYKGYTDKEKRKEYLANYMREARGRRKELLDVAKELVKPIYRQLLREVQGELDKWQIPSFAEVQESAHAQGLTISEEDYNLAALEMETYLEKKKILKIEIVKRKFD